MSARDEQLVQSRAEEVLVASLLRDVSAGITADPLPRAARRRAERERKRLEPALAKAGAVLVSSADQYEVLGLVVAAMSRRGVALCPHAARGALSGGLTFVLLGVARAVCGTCLPTANRLDTDGRCDLCDLPTVRFHPMDLGLGTLFVHGDVCPDCFAHVRRFAGTGGAA